MEEKPSVFVGEDTQPIVPQLVPVTIRWVEADRALRYTLMMCVGLLIPDSLLRFSAASEATLHWVFLSNLTLQVVGRTVWHYLKRRELDQKKAQLGIR